MNLVDVYRTADGKSFLYELLKERTPDVNISHRDLPSWDEHLAFIASKPYTAWYIINERGFHAGAVYLSKNDEVGIFVSQEWQGDGLARKAIEDLMLRHSRPRYLANMNPANKPSHALFSSMGFKHIQNTYELLP